MKRVLFFFVVLSFSPAVEGAKPPKWIQQVHWEDGVYEYFVGVSTRAATEEEGRREALDNATTEAFQALFGITGKMDLTSFANLQKIQISQDVFVSTDQIQLKTEPVDIYVKETRVGDTFKYTVYRSIRVDKKAAKTELERLKQASTKKESLEGKVTAPSKDLVAVTVETEGVILNDDEPEAKSKAVRVGLERSCERLLKEWFYPETLTKNYSRLKSNIYDRCPGFAENHEVLAGFREENLYKMKLTVYLKGGDIRRKLMDLGLFREKVQETGMKPPAEGAAQ